ncbi:MAG: DUF1549 domain-containing protein, partial [Acidobacteria bacterium]|nr:DUF1549 domain-containing protein [Acidobacteriota bacterium]
MSSGRGAIVSAAGLLVISTAMRLAGAPQTPQATPHQIDFFESKVRPLLVNSCFDCHTADEKGGLRLDSRDGVLKGGESGPAIIVGDPDASLLIKAVRHVQGISKMPRSAPKLSETEIAALAEWIKMGAPWPSATNEMAASPGSDTPTPVASVERPLDPKLKTFWSFQPVRKPAVPQPANGSWAKSDIDRFVLAALERQGMAPVGTADKRTLIRRATLDLTGLPATVDEIETFQKDDGPDAFAKVVDRLLASPRYGETWGRLWLDVARYAEDDPRSLDPMGRGYAPYPNAYLYRDWVIKAFNDDLPYDQFVKAQIAADHLDETSRVRHLPAL